MLRLTLHQLLKENFVFYKLHFKSGGYQAQKAHKIIILIIFCFPFEKILLNICFWYACEKGISAKLDAKNGSLFGRGGKFNQDKIGM